jgi:hypothetical protein
MALARPLVVEAVPPTIVSLVLDGSDAVITWTSMPESNYQLLFKDNLQDENWQTDPAIITATDSTTTVTNAIGANQQRFYKILLKE